MRAFQECFRWASHSAGRFVLVIGLGAYGVILGIGLTLYLALVGGLPIGLSAGVGFGLSEIAGLLFGGGMWAVSRRPKRKAKT